MSGQTWSYSLTREIDLKLYYPALPIHAPTAVWSALLRSGYTLRSTFPPISALIILVIINHFGSLHFIFIHFHSFCLQKSLSHMSYVAYGLSKGRFNSSHFELMLLIN